MAELAAQTVEELDFDTPDAIADQPGEPALAAGPTENTPAAEVEEAIEGPTRSGGSRGRAVRGRGGARGGKAKVCSPVYFLIELRGSSTNDDRPKNLMSQTRLLPGSVAYIPLSEERSDAKRLLGPSY